MSEDMTQPSESTEATTEATTEVEATTVDSEGNSQSETTYYNGKFKSVSDLEKSYGELQSTFSKKLGAFTGSPEEYTLNEGIEVTDGVMEFAKNNQFSNDALNGLAEAYQTDQQAQRDAYMSEQRELLGKDADTRLTNVQDWARANLGEDAMDVFSGMITTAKSVEMFEKIAKMQTGTSPAPSKPTVSVDRDSLNAMRFAKDEFGNRRISSDPQYRAKVDGMTAEFIANGGKLR